MAALIDFAASEVQFLDHLAPIWHQLAAPARGVLAVPERLEAAARDRGLRPTSGVVTRTLAEHGDRPVLVASYGDVKLARSAHRRRIGFLEHGIGQSYAGDPRSERHPSYAGGADRADVSLFLCPNEISADRWREAYPRARVRVVGCPKLDEIFQARAPRVVSGPPVVAISFHWDCYVCAETRSAFTEYRPVLPAIGERFRALGHGHPRLLGGHEGGMVAAIYRRAGLELVPDFRDVLARADVYAVDNSSTLYEFAATGRPVVVLNATLYRRTVNHGLRFWEAATVGRECDDPASLPDVLERALEDRPTDLARRERALNLVYAHRGTAADAATAALVEWAG